MNRLWLAMVNVVLHTLKLRCPHVSYVSTVKPENYEL